MTAAATLEIEAAAASVKPADPTRPFSMSIRLPHRSVSALRPILGLALALAGTAAGTAEAQRTGGSIGVSLTILESVDTRAIGVSRFRLERDGHATLETRTASTGRVSRIVMARIASSGNGFQPVGEGPVVLPGEGAQLPASSVGPERITRRPDIGRETPVAVARDVQLRIEYLVVAGT